MPDQGSEWVDRMRDLLDPTTQLYHPDRRFVMDVLPAQNTLAVTDSFYMSAALTGPTGLAATTPLTGGTLPVAAGVGLSAMAMLLGAGGLMALARRRTRRMGIET